MSRAIIQPVLLCLLAGSASASVDAYRIVSSKTISETVLPPATWPQRAPSAVATAGGWCVAWFDSRQGGIGLAARIDVAGRLLDRTGTAVPGGPIAVFDSDDGCVVLSATGYGYVRTRIPAHSDARPEIEPFRQALRLVWSGSREMLLQEATATGEGRFLLVGSDGITRRASVVLPLASSVLRHGTGFLALLTTHRGSESEYEVVQMDADLQVIPLIGSILVPWNEHVTLAATEKEILLVKTRTWPEPGLELLRFSVLGELLGSIHSPPPAGPLLEVTHDGVHWLLEYGGHRGTNLVLVSDGTKILRTRDVPSHRARAVRGATALHVWGTGEEPLQYAISPVEPVGPGEPLSHAPPNEVLIDSGSDDGTVALLWFEPNPTTTRVWVAASPKENPNVARRLLVLEQPAWIEDPMSLTGTDPAVAIHEGVGVVAWQDRAGLHYRRFHPDGWWMDPAPVLLRPLGWEQSISFSPHGLIATDSGFALVWSEGHAFARLLKAALLDLDGRTQMFDLKVDPETRVPAEPAIVHHPGGWVVAWNEGALICPLVVCVPGPFLRAAAYDERFTWLQGLTHGAHSGDIGVPQLTFTGDELVLHGAQSVFFYRRAPSGSWEEPRRVPFAILHPGTHTLGPAYGDYVSLGYGLLAIGGGVLAAFDAGGRLMGHQVSSEAAEILAFPLGDDEVRSGQLPYVPQLVRDGERILLFGSEVSTDPADGFVRRLRVHVLKPAIRKTRPAGRSTR